MNSTELPISPSGISPDPEPIQIQQLYEHVELYAQGTPPQNTLFVLGQERGPALASSIQFTLSLDEQGPQETTELLLIDPPRDAVERFRLEGNVAALYTTPLATESPSLTFPQVQTQAGGVAHIRIGDHFLDLHSFQAGTIIHLPTLGIVCSGVLGSDALLPLIADHTDGDDVLNALRFLASLVKNQHFQLMIPQCGTAVSDAVDVMGRLAADVAYIHALQRVVEATTGQEEDGLATLLSLSDSLLPSTRSSSLSEERHLLNLQALYLAQESGLDS
ncbi:MAG: hypothetical protein AAF702_25515 [Chloroflexota bacterium]